MSWIEEVMGLVDNDKNAALADDMYNVGNNASTNVYQGETKEEEPEQPAQPAARAERKRAGEDVSNEMHDHTNPFNRRVGVMPDDIADHDTNKGTENDKLSDEAKTDEDGKGDKYKGIRDIVDQLREYADSEEEKMNLSDEEKSKKKREEKRRMLMSGMADAANAFHRAYSYARGIKAMEGSNKDYSKEAKKEMREDEEWHNKNRDRIMNYRAKAAELEKTIAALKKQDVDTEYKWKNLERLNAEHQRLVDKDYEARVQAEWKRDLEQGKLDVQKRHIEIEEAYKKGLISLRQREVSIKELNALGKEVTKEKYDPITGETIIETTTTKPVGTGGTSGNSNAGTSNTGKKPLPTGKKPLPQS